jgi:hypothetical protein
MATVVVEINPRKMLKALLYMIALLLSLNVLGIIINAHFDYRIAKGMAKIIDFDLEKNIPTLYSTLALIFSSALLFFIASEYRKTKQHNILWFTLSAIFLFLAVDETASLHEHLLKPTRDFLGTSGLLYYAWVIPYSIGLMALGVVYSKFLHSLPKKTKWLFITSGAIFVLGAIGFEMLSGWQAEVSGKRTYLYMIFYTCEEALEMTGIAIFIYALLSHIVNEMGYRRIVISSD